MTEYIDIVVQYVPVWGFLIVFLLMTVESSFVPFPSEIVMIPAAFIAGRGEFTFHTPWVDMAVIFAAGLAGSMAGAYINYYLARRLGEPFLRKYGKYVLISPAALDRSEEIFRKYGDIATFVCRLLPAIRQLISLPAGLVGMPLGRFSLFTALGAGFWCLVLMGIGYWCSIKSAAMSYAELVDFGKTFIHDHYVWVFAVIFVFVATYLAIQKMVMKPASSTEK